MSTRDAIRLEADVLVIGGSLSGAWAALAAREAGAHVVIVDKGWIGTAGIVAAATGGGYFLLPDDPDQRQRTIGIRHDQAAGLDDPAFCERVYDQSYRAYRALEQWGFRAERMGSFRGPDAMIFLRRRLQRLGVHILDHSPALDLLLDGAGTVAGACGIHRKTGEAWTVRAGAVILATGGNAFRSGALGTGGVTGDGYLMAAEAGVGAVGMEFSGHYAFVAQDSSCTKGGMYHIYGQIFDENGTKLDPEPGWAAVPAAGEALMAGRKVYAQIDVGPDDEERVRAMMPNFFTYFARTGVAPFRRRWPVGLLYEGTVRAAGGLAVGARTETRVPGLYAVGDLADKTRLTGAQMSGAGAAIAWCVTSGEWAGRDAAAFARHLGARQASRPVESARHRPASVGGLAAAECDRAVQEEILPLEKNLFRSGVTLAASLDRLDRAWATGLVDGHDGRTRLRARESEALLLTARWIYRAALARTETRGLHRRRDYPESDPAQRHLLHVGGLASVAVGRAEARLENGQGAPALQP